MCAIVSAGSCVHGRTLNHEASPTPPSVQSVAEQDTSPLTANTPGEGGFQTFFIVAALFMLFCTLIRVCVCVAHLLHTDHLAASPLSRLRTRHVWTRSTCPSWPSWERLRSPPLEDTPSARAERLGRLEGIITNRRWSAGTLVASITLWGGE